MKKLLLLPTVIFPYMLCFCCGSLSNEIITVIAIAAGVTGVAAIVCNIVYIFATKNTSPTELIKTAFWVKVCHIPTYVIIYIIGVILGLMFFMTFPIIIFLILIDLITLWLSGMISIYSIIRGFKEKSIFSKAVLIVSLILQFMFCADIITMFILYLKAVKAEKSKKE